MRALLPALLLALVLQAAAGAQGLPSALPPLPDPLPIPAEPSLLPEPEPRPVPPERTYWRHIVVHHSATPSGNLAAFEIMHRRKGWDGVGYHFVITNGQGGPDGRLEVSERWWKQKHGAHAGGLSGGLPEERNDYNEFGIGICLVGNLEQRAPTRSQMKTLAGLVRKLRAEFGIPLERVVGHRHVRSTACPGRHFPWRSLFALLGDPHPRPLLPRPAAATFERCLWCLESGAPLSRPIPVSAALPDLPPPLFLRTE